MSKTLEEQFGKIKMPKLATDSLRECRDINNFIGFKVLQYIIANHCKLERRNSLDSDSWHPGTIREFLCYFANAGIGDNNSFNSWTLNFWRIKTEPTDQEKYDLTHINHADEE